MDVSGVSSRVASATPPVRDDSAKIQLARAAAADQASKVVSAKAASTAAVVADDTRRTAGAVADNKVDMYL
jgi:hypothetical protein